MNGKDRGSCCPQITEPKLWYTEARLQLGKGFCLRQAGRSLVTGWISSVKQGVKLVLSTLAPLQGDKVAIYYIRIIKNLRPNLK